MINSYQNKDEDEDSGLVDDAFDVLPDEQTLPLDYYDLDLDLSEENFGRCSTSEDFSDCLELDISLSTSPCSDLIEDPKSTFLPDLNTNLLPPILIEKKLVEDNISNNTTENINLLQPLLIKEGEQAGGKLVSFSKEQARQWRRKRLLKSNEKKMTDDKVKMYPAHLQPLLPLPKTLKPMKGRGELEHEENTERVIKPEEKLANPLLGGEKMSTKIKRGPMPMKLRALPESFWKEPHAFQTSSLARSNYSVLPPLFSSEGKNSEVMNIRPVTPPDEKGRSPRHSPRNKKKWVMANQPDTELLFSLFDHLENKVDERLIVKRGRPKKIHLERIPPPPVRNKDDDPCIIDALATKLFPELSLNHIPGSEEKSSSSNFAVIRIGKGRRSLEFPAIQAKENYPAILNELVTHM